MTPAIRSSLNVARMRLAEAVALAQILAAAAGIAGDEILSTQINAGARAPGDMGAGRKLRRALTGDAADQENADTENDENGDRRIEIEIDTADKRRDDRGENRWQGLPHNCPFHWC